MAILEIVTLPEAILRQPARPVTQFDDELQQLIDDMIETMRVAPGVGLAAPQVGRPLQLCVVETLPELDDEGQEIEGSRQLYVLVNPQIIWESRDEVDGIEGCLSIPGYVGEVARNQAIRVRAQDRHGRKVRYRVQGWDARIFQHEIDHLRGVLFIDKLTAPENFWTEADYRAQFEDEAEAGAETAIMQE